MNGTKAYSRHREYIMNTFMNTWEAEGLRGDEEKTTIYIASYKTDSFPEYSRGPDKRTDSVIHRKR